MLEIEGKTVDDTKDEDIVTAQNVSVGSVVKVNSTVGVVVSVHSERITMPNLLGMNIENVRDLLFNLGLNYTIAREDSYSVAKDCVISQSIDPYVQISTSEKIELVISDGVEKNDAAVDNTPFPVEDLTDKTYDQIISEKEKHSGGYTGNDNYIDNNWNNKSSSTEKNEKVNYQYPVEITERVYDPSEPEGKVISQKPSKGQMITSADTVQLVVSTRNKNVLVPDVTLLDRESAEYTLRQIGLKTEFEEEPSDSVKEGCVISQVPEYGKTVSIESTVKLKVSSGKSTVIMPDLIGKKLDEAKTILDETGLVAKYTYSTDQNSPEDRVLKQSADPGKEMRKGEAVLITLSTKKDVKEIPSVIGMDSEKAKQTLTDSGFKIEMYDLKNEKTDKEISSELWAVAQSPEAGLYYPIGDTVQAVFGDTDVPGFDLSEESISMNIGDEFVLKIFVPNKGVNLTHSPKPNESSVIKYTNINSDMPDHYEMTIKAIASGTEMLKFYFGNTVKECRIDVR